MSKMTDEQIKKALECCIKSSNFGECFENKCPFVSENGCKVGKETLYPYVLDLINHLKGDAIYYRRKAQNQKQELGRLNAEIEKLNVELVGMRGACNSYKMHYDNANAEIERLQVRLRKERHQFEDLGKMYSEIRAEAIKELKAKIHNKLHEAEMHGNFEPVVTREMFDSVVKEMEGDGK